MTLPQTEAPAHAPARFPSPRPSTLRTLLLAMGALIVVTAIQIGWPQLLGQGPSAVDYNIFDEVGHLARDGQAALAYDAQEFEAHQATRPGNAPFMPWTYPPQFNLFAEMLSLVPPGVGYALFIALGLGALSVTLFRLAPGEAGTAIALTLPAFLITIRAGQNGFLTALLFALFFAFALRGRGLAAGLSLGLLAYKPHLGLGAGLVALWRGGWVMVLSAFLTVAAALGAATLAYGTGIWPAFLQAVEESGIFLRAGGYPMERMVSLYAFLLTIGLPAALALTAQAALAIAALGLITFTLARRWPLAQVLALSVIAGLTLSPYGYDYDLMALAPALALALPTLRAHARPGEARALTAALWLATGWGLLTLLLGKPLAAAGLSPVSLGAVGHLVALALVTRVFARANAVA